MTNLNQTQHLLGHTVEGHYLLSSVEQRTTKLDTPFLDCQLEDATGSLQCYVWASSGLQLQASLLQTNTPVRARLDLRHFNGQTVGDITAIRTAEEFEIHNAALFLPFSKCPDIAKPSLESLVEIIGGLTKEPLRRFMNKVLLDQRINVNLLTCRASAKYHHAEQGGLLCHSVEVAQICAKMLNKQVSDKEYQTALVAALLHDIGKVRTVGSNIRHTHYNVVCHETQSNRLLEPHYDWLRSHAPDLATGVEYILDFINRPNRFEKFPAFIGAEAVIMADHFSTALSRKKPLEKFLKKTLSNDQLASVLPINSSQAKGVEPELNTHRVQS